MPADRNLSGLFTLGVLVVGLFLGSWAPWRQLAADAADRSTFAPSGKADDRPSERSGTGNAARAVTVRAAAASPRDIRIVRNALGTVTSRNSVVVQSRVDGQLLRVHFEEGQLVRAGDLLAEIDPRPFEVKLTQARGQLARDEALLRNAELDLSRLQQLRERGVIPPQQVDAQQSLVRQYQGALLADKGQIDEAQLQLGFTRITAPISGRIGLRLVDPGNNIRTSEGRGLATINEVQPISVVFAVPEDIAVEVVRRLQDPNRAGEPLMVEALDRAGRHTLAIGRLVSADNQIDANTGTIRLRAEFSNDDQRLLHNQFVNVRLTLDTLRGVTTVPAAAVQRGVPGTFVFLLDAGESVTVRPVTVGPGEDDIVSIEQGLSPGDRVIVNGADKLREGTKVRLVAEAGTAAAVAPAEPAANPTADASVGMAGPGSLATPQAGDTARRGDR